MSKKILAVDLDGTLLNSDKTISEANKTAIQNVLEAGHYVAIATGRAVSSGRQIAQTLGLTRPGCYLIAYNGGVIYDCAADCILHEARLPVEYAEYLVSEAEKWGIYVQAYSATKVLARKASRELNVYIRRTHMPYQIEKDIWEMINEEPPKILLISLDDRKKLEQFRKAHAEWEKDKCTSFFSCDEYLEYCPLGVTKGAGLSFLCDFLNISMDSAVAIGDQENDMSMFGNAYVGAAMKNAEQKVKNLADYVTENDNDHDGVAEVIYKFILPKTSA